MFAVCAVHAIMQTAFGSAGGRSGQEMNNVLRAVHFRFLTMIQGGFDIYPSAGIEDKRKDNKVYVLLQKSD